MRKAVIDVGSNSLILVVEEFDGQSWNVIQEMTAVTSLGEGTKETRLLGERGMTASLKALFRMYTVARSLDADPIQAAGTMALRIADNRAEFMTRAAAQDTPVFILSGEDEAQLGFESVAIDPTFGSFQRISVIDPGGQSTEILTASRTPQGWDVSFRHSFPVGTLGMREGYLSGESPDGGAVLYASAYLDDMIGLSYLPGGAGQSILLGATGTNLVSIREKLTHWDPYRVHGAYLDFEEISKAVGWMMPMSDAQRAAIPGIEPGREKTLHIGALIAERCLHALASPGCLVSVRGWRHALLEQGLPRTGGDR
jgi:exopolyphosphatase/guanosine-5'-triphosphate,3'-diphosphate pyrophosphatase